MSVHQTLRKNLLKAAGLPQNFLTQVSQGVVNIDYTYYMPVAGVKFVYTLSNSGIILIFIAHHTTSVTMPVMAMFNQADGWTVKMKSDYGTSETKPETVEWMNKTLQQRGN